ncbi:MAG: preprotein translocase subunit SecY [Deltaproteobacteria bacterium]|nr:MAG: preprotein translocase subunit SecY [Deltaproteobacteria bacterium]
MANIFSRIWEMKDLRNRVLFTLAMLGVYRLGIFVPVPGVNREELGKFFAGQSDTLFGLYDMFSGGALMQFSVFVLGIMPYITASIIMQLMGRMVPTLERIQKEGQQGRNRMTQYTRYLTIAIAVVQSYGMAFALEQMSGQGGSIVIQPGWGFRLMTVLTVTAGSCFLMWLGEQMSERGVGNGASILITAGIIATFPSDVFAVFRLVGLGEMNLLQAVLLFAFLFAVVMAIVFVERGQRRVPLQYAKRVLGRRVYQGETTYLPLKVNISGVIPPIFASSLLMLPSTVGAFADIPFLDWLSGQFFPGSWLYNVTFGALVIFFAFFYTAITFSPVDVAENLKKQAAFIPRVRPGSETIDYLDWLLTRLTTGGAVYLAVVCVAPTILASQTGLNIFFNFGGTGVLILVGVSLDTVAQIEAKLAEKEYDASNPGPGGGKKARGRRRRAGGQAGMF